MRLNIRHKTVYRYEEAPLFSAQVFRLTPRTNVSQRVQRWKIDCPGELSAWSDAFGNICHTLAIDDPPEHLEIMAQGEVVTTDMNGVLPAEHGDLPIEVFLRQTPQTEPDMVMAGFAQSYDERLSANRVDGLHALMGDIRERVDYELGETDVESTACEAFANGKGVCQDHAHIFIGCLRTLGIPARYVSGYLYDGEQEQAFTAGHAWASAWVDKLGWVSFDVSNCKSATENHVSIAVGLDYDSASPIRGVLTGGTGGEQMDVTVQVSAAQQ